ncbi:MAG: hypothetical protein KatS3mg118_2609 [Paracoccaceae bacterium]|nr:MAG: hypothetical protein KatS3mg118_2609 [Paracoccaceae bacterium]
MRILLDELGLDYARNEALSAPGAKDPASAPTLQVPVLRGGAVTLRESGTICEYLLATYPERPAAPPPLARHAFRPEEPRRDRLVFSTTQTFGTVATTISQMTRTGVGVTDNAHLTRSAEKLGHILTWLDRFPRIAALLERLDERDSFRANPIWWWEPGVTGYEPDGTPILGDGT